MATARYVPALRRPEAGSFQRWKFGSRVASQKIGDTIEKSLFGFRGDEELAQECVEAWKAKGWDGFPSSPSSFFHKAFRSPRLPYSANGPLVHHFFGGWQEVFRLGVVPGPLYYYDLKSAYRWAGSQPLPLAVRPYRPGDKKYVAIMDQTRINFAAPAPLQKDRVLVTDEDVRLFDLEGSIDWGVSWESEAGGLVDQCLDYLESFMPARAFKIASQTYWGRWASWRPLVMERFKDGELASVSTWQNPVLNLVWATLIVHRVMRRVWTAAETDSVLVIVDAVLKTSPMDIPQTPVVGDWTLKEFVSEDVFVRAPGVWTTVPVATDPVEWLRHAGYGGPVAKPDPLGSPCTLAETGWIA